ncbi:Isoleucine--tRNA ligase [Buchnera aphidicola (Cinara kochiana kochiana)]|uniref:Isoleucine--tRNA ligase n=1 Tax=Buchnera aphidicola (Cinara kochiana kochiana) TaxID=2518976 RepID=A0A451D5B4_9GAMM|nr:isoleucine--tRNA ligase [Buchnera aphidicola]VFP81018.1 Isoleucine--tRNA ligase [Buchnera aphidicola (Cinara kochiana kochiana)]
MKTIKTSLNLPKTKFPMQANLVIKEIEILKKWKKNKLYDNLHVYNKKKKIFSLHDGPPYANGDIHIGHAVNKILKDIILKFKRMSGFFAPYIPCWDCHGLPIEQKVEQILKKKNNINKKQFRKICYKYVLTQVHQQKKDFIRLGILADWDNSNLTLDYVNQSNTINVLAKIVEKKYIYRDLRPIHWCFHCQSSLAEAEIEYQKKKSLSLYVSFILKNNSLSKIKFNNPTKDKINPVTNISIVIFTTTPWTLPTCQAIAVNPQLKYQLIKIEKKYYIFEKKLTKKIIKKINIKKWKIINCINGKNLENLQCIHPFLNIYVPIILSTHVSNELGTGAVHMSPDHGYEDFIACKKYQIKPTQIVNSYGFYNLPKFYPLNNIHIFNKEDIILKLLKNNDKIFFLETIQHSYPHCWRHTKPVILRTTLQWFIKLSDPLLQDSMLQEIKKVLWIPGWGKNKMKIMLKNRPDWCISRQRTWGIPIPFFIHKHTGQLHPDTVDIMKKISKKIKKYGYTIWWKSNTHTWIKKNADMYEKINDVLDVWFESGSNHQLKIYKNYTNNTLNYIANLYLEGSDQHRGWFMSSLITSVITKNHAPYKSVLTHGFVVNELGQKMSKSLENNTKPKDIIKKWGADILRLWVAYTNYTNDISISDKILHQISDHYRRIRNTIRFLFSNIFDFKKNIHVVKYKKMLLLDRWILDITYTCQKKIIKNYSIYNFHEVVQKIIHFCSIKLGSCYLELIKDRLYTKNSNSIERRSGQTAIFYILNSLIRWIAPILSFTAEEAWNYFKIKKEKSIFTEKWFKKTKPLPNNIPYNIFFWKKIFIVRHEVNKYIEQAKKNKYIHNSLEIMLTLYVDIKLFNLLLSFNNELKYIFLVSETQLHRYSSAPKIAYSSNNIKNLKIIIKKSNKIKCPRCWNYSKKNNFTNKNTNICYKCLENINQTGKKHIFL